MDKQRAEGIATLFGIVLLLGGTHAVYSGVTFEPQAQTELQATVLDSHLVKQEADTSSETSGYTLVVNYSYEYDGTTYTSTNFRPGLDEMFYQQKDVAQKKLKQYEEGSTIQAYIDRDNPKRSRLLGARTGEKMFGGALMAVFGGIITVLLGSSYLITRSVPDPEDVNAQKYELEEQFLTAFEEIDAYPIEEIEQLDDTALDGSTQFSSNDMEFTARLIEHLVESEPDTPCEDAEELTAYLLDDLEEQGYFYRAIDS